MQFALIYGTDKFTPFYQQGIQPHQCHRKPRLDHRDGTQSLTIAGLSGCGETKHRLVALCNFLDRHSRTGGQPKWNHVCSWQKRKIGLSFVQNKRKQQTQWGFKIKPSTKTVTAKVLDLFNDTGKYSDKRHDKNIDMTKRDATPVFIAQKHRKMEPPWVAEKGFLSQPCLILSFPRIQKGDRYFHAGSWRQSSIVTQEVVCQWVAQYSLLSRQAWMINQTKRLLMRCLPSPNTWNAKDRQNLMRHLLQSFTVWGETTLFNPPHNEGTWET